MVGVDLEKVPMGSLPAGSGDTSSPVGVVVSPLAVDARPYGMPEEAPVFVEIASGVLRRYLLFVVIVMVPTLVAAVYFFFLVSDQYISETRFVIRSMASSGFGGLSVMTQSQGLSRTEDDTHLVTEFLRSRDAVRLLAEHDNLLSALSHPNGDVFFGFPTMLSGHSKEDLYEHFGSFIDVSYKAATGITTLKVRAFTPEDSRRLAMALLKHAEAVVNQLNRRAREDAVVFSRTVAKAAEERVVEAQNKIAGFRNRELVLDPGKQSAATLELVNKLFAEKLTLETTLAETRSATPDSPKIAAVLNRLDAIEGQITGLQAGLAGSNSSMASKLAEFERLTLERELAAKSLTAALSSLENAIKDAERQQLYLERVVEPNFADKSQYPKRFQSLATFIALAVALFWITRSIIGVVLEHDV